MPVPWPSPTGLTPWPRSRRRPGSPRADVVGAVVSTRGFRDLGPSRLTSATRGVPNASQDAAASTMWGWGAEAFQGTRQEPNSSRSRTVLSPTTAQSPRPPGTQKKPGNTAEPSALANALPRGSFPLSLCPHVTRTEKTGRRCTQWKRWAGNTRTLNKIA